MSVDSRQLSVVKDESNLYSMIGRLRPMLCLVKGLEISIQLTIDNGPRTLPEFED